MREGGEEHGPLLRRGAFSEHGGLGTRGLAQSANTCLVNAGGPLSRYTYTPPNHQVRIMDPGTVIGNGQKHDLGCHASSAAAWKSAGRANDRPDLSTARPHPAIALGYPFGCVPGVGQSDLLEDADFGVSSMAGTKFDQPGVGPKLGSQCSDLGDLPFFRLRL